MTKDAVRAGIQGHLQPLYVFDDWALGEISISLNGHELVLSSAPSHAGKHARFVHGVALDGELVLTLDEAKKLRSDLMGAIERYEFMDVCAIDDFGGKGDE